MNIPFAIAGAGGGGKSGGGGSRAPQEDPDSLQSQALARGIDLICEGPIVGLVNGLQSVYVDGTPLAGPDHLVDGQPQFNFKGISIATRLGTQDQTYIGAEPGEPAIPSVESETDVSVEVTQSSPVVRQILDTGADAVRVRLGFPALSEVNPSNGDTHGSTVQMRIELQKSGGSYVAQPVGMSYQPMMLTGGYLVNGSAAKSFLVRVVHDRVDYDEDFPENSHFTYEIQYKADGSSTWLTFVQKTIGVASRRSPQSVGTDITPVSLPSSGIWNIRAVKISGNPSLISYQGAAMVPDTVITVTGKTMSEYERSYTIPLEAGTGPWNVRVSRITADATTQYVQNESWWKSYTLVRNEKLSYPHSALVGFTIDSSQFSRIPTRAYDMKFLIVKVPSNYDPITRQYTGTWDGTFVLAWTDNPAWCFYDLATNERYGLGKHIDAALLDKWYLYEIGRYCDELVPSGYVDGAGSPILEPRFTLNCYIQTRAEAYKLLNDLTSVFRGMAYWAGGSIVAVQDSPSDPEMLFTAANVVDGVFQYASSSKRARHTVALVRWNDPTNFCKQAVEYVDDEAGIARYGINTIETTAFGCTSRGQARRLGKWILYSELEEREMVTFRTGLDGTYVRPMSVFEISDPNRAGRRVGGRVVSATTTAVTLDASVTIESGKTYTLSVILEDGSVVDRSVTNSVGAHTTINLSSALPSAPASDSIWVLKASDLTTTLWRVLSISEPTKGTLEIVGLAHFPGKFDLVEQGVQFAAIPDSYITPESSRIMPPTGLTLVEEAYGIQGGVVGYRIAASWSPSASPNVIGYQLSYRLENGNWTYLTNQAHLSATIENVLVGNYEVRVRALNDRGLYSTYETAEIAITHTSNGLPAIEHPLFVASKCTYTDKIQLVWGPVNSDALAYYEVRTDANWGVDDAGLIYRGLATTFTMKPSGAASYTFQIKSHDRQGNFSVGYDSITLTYSVPAPVFVTIEGGFRRVRIEWEPINDESYDVVEVWRATVNNRAGAAKAGEIHSNVFVDTSGLEIGETYYYWLRTRSIFGTFSAWDTGDAAGHSATISAINTADLADHIISQMKLAPGIVPPEIVDSLPALPDAAYPEGKIVYLTQDDGSYKGKKLYRNTGASTPADEYTDDFNDGSLGSAYTTLPGFSALAVDNYRLKGTTSEDNGAYRNDWSGVDQYARAQLKVAGGWMGVVARANGSSNYEFYADLTTTGAGRSIGLYKLINGSGADISTGSATINLESVIEIRVTGTNPVVVKGYVDGVEKISYTDSAGDRIVTPGNPGWTLYGGAIRVDNIGWGDFGSAGGGWSSAVDGADVVDLLITHEQITDQLVAGQIAAGAVGANEIAGNTAAFKTLVVGSYENIAVDGGPTASSGDHWFLSDATIHEYPGIHTGFVFDLDGANAIITQKNADGTSAKFPVRQGDSFYLSFYASPYTVASPCYMGILVFDAGGAVLEHCTINAPIDTTGFPKHSGVVNVTHPDAAYGLLRCYNSAPSATRWIVADLRCRRALDGSMVVEGSIDADRLSADHLSAVNTESGTFQQGYTAPGDNNTTPGAGLKITGGKIEAYGLNHTFGGMLVSSDGNYMVTIGAALTSAGKLKRYPLNNATNFTADGRLHVYKWDTAPATDTWIEASSIGLDTSSGSVGIAKNPDSFGVGFYGEAAGPYGIGVMGNSLYEADHSNAGYGGKFRGYKGAINLHPFSTVESVPDWFAEVGTLAVDGVGNLYLRKTSSWVKIG